MKEGEIYMPNVLTVNGKNEILLSIRDFENLVYRNMGGEAGDYFREALNELQQQADYTAQKVQADLQCYENTICSYNDAFQELSDGLEEMAELLSRSRTNKEKLREIARNMRKTIRNQL